MGLLSKLFGTNSTQNDGPQTPPKDLREPFCPSCGGKLAKVPGAKTMCPHCKKPIYVRTRPEDNARVLVNDEGAEKIEEAWAIENGVHDEYLAEKQRVKDTKEKLTKQFGTEASDADVQWRILNEDLMKCAQDQNWGFYRNVILAMGDHVKKAGKDDHALRTYLEVCYIDLNGPSNGNKDKSPEILKEYPPFDLKVAFLAPGIIEYIKKLSDKLGYDLPKIKEIFMTGAQRHYESLKIYPLKPEECWPKVEAELKKS